MEPNPPITRLLEEWRDGDERALHRLMPLVYEELRRIAHRQLYRQRTGHTLNTTALVHEAYLRLVDQAQAEWTDRTHFFALAARAMRHILVDYARSHSRAKRGGGWRRITLDEKLLTIEQQADLVMALDEALIRLSRLNERIGRVVECRFFAGMNEIETAAVLGVTTRTVRRDWVKAKLWLYAELAEDKAV